MEYSTYTEFVQREIIDPIMAGGAVTDAREEFYIDDIADELCVIDTSRINPTYSLDTEVDFWDVVYAYQKIHPSK